MPAPLPGSNEHTLTVWPEASVIVAVAEGTNSRKAIQSASLGSPSKVRATNGMRSFLAALFLSRDFLPMTGESMRPARSRSVGGEAELGVDPRALWTCRPTSGRRRG